ncbi:MAG: SHOCT domain-containing protein [Firmicutes bacterium]|nr:SHOCT domain-containing protein [Bacillota bacterium]
MAVYPGGGAPGLWMMGWCSMWFGWLLVTIGVIVGIIYFIRYLIRHFHTDPAEELLRKRYAQGEISDEEFSQRLQRLKEAKQRK